MSYSFTVRKSEGTLVLEGDSEILEAIASHIPDGACFTINGHTPSENSSKTGTLAVQLLTEDRSQGDLYSMRRYVAGAQASYNLEVPIMGRD